MIMFLHIDDGCYGIMVGDSLISSELNKEEFIEIKSFLIAMVPDIIYNKI